MSPKKILEYGGYISGALLIVFGVVAIYMGVDGRSTVRDSIKQEQIVFGSAEDPAVAEHAKQWADEQVTTGDQARAFAEKGTIPPGVDDAEVFWKARAGSFYVDDKTDWLDAYQQQLKAAIRWPASGQQAAE